VNPILLVKHDPWETCGLAIPVLEAEGVGLAVVEAWDQTAPWPSPDEVSGIVEFGGDMNVDDTERLPSLAREREIAREAVERGVPFLGACLGAQILARAMDHPVFRAHAKEIGFEPLRPTPAAAADPILSAYSEGDMVFHWHEDTFELPRGAELLATGDVIDVQSFRVGACAWGLQFHFEIDAPELELWLRDADDKLDLKATWGKSSSEIRDESVSFLARHEERGREVFRRFADVVRRTGR
jgi:GMP synthase (glutamine-hydrolysing)